MASVVHPSHHHRMRVGTRTHDHFFSSSPNRENNSFDPIVFADSFALHFVGWYDEIFSPHYFAVLFGFGHPPIWLGQLEKTKAEKQRKEWGHK